MHNKHMKKYLGLYQLLVFSMHMNEMAELTKCLEP